VTRVNDLKYLFNYFELRSAVSDDNRGIEVCHSYHGGLLGAHMHDPSATRPGEVHTMIGMWLGAPLSTPSDQIRLWGRPDAEVDSVSRSKGHDW
jgi:hypothetical protein